MNKCVRHFAAGRYESVVEINFVERPEFKVIVRDGYSVESVIRNISVVKLYLSDTGLLMAQLDRESQEDVRVRRDLGTWKGGFFENVVSEALVKKECPLAYYKKEGSTLEMDFLVRAKESLVPIEVKAGNNQAKSLRTMISSASYKDISWGVKFVRGNVGWMNRVLTIPQWSAFLLPKILEFYPKT